MIVIILPEAEYLVSHYNTKQWEQSVKITNWEHDFEKKQYTIKYTEKES